MAEQNSDTALNLEIRDRVKGVDAILTKIIKDRSVWKEFFRDPAGVLSRMGMAPPLTSEGAWKYNKMFYALLTSKELMQFLYDQFKHFQPSTSEYGQKAVDKLKQGVIQHDPGLDVECFNHIKSNPSVHRVFLKIALNSLNNENVFSRRYDSGEIDGIVDKLVEGASANRPLAEMGKSLPLGVEDDPSFTVLAVVPPAVAVPAVAEAVGGGTAVVVGPVVVAGLAAETIDDLHKRAFLGDDESLRATTLLGLIFDFVGELAEHLNQSERLLRD